VGGRRGRREVSEGSRADAELARAQSQAAAILGDVDVEEVRADTTAANTLVVLGAAFGALDLLTHGPIFAWPDRSRRDRAI
jgi:hypothetical protein